MIDLPHAEPNPVLRIAAAITAALAFAFGVYLLLEATRPDMGLVSFSFLLILPAAICAFVSYIADPLAVRSRGAYLKVPLWLLLAVSIASVFVLREGVICIVILSPLWLASGMAGAALTYRLRRRVEDGRRYCTALLLAPLLAMQLEPMLPLSTNEAEVTRSVVVEASVETLWPLLRGIPDVRSDEGKWTISQNLLRIPRPVGAHLVGEGVGATRWANWGEQIRFRERITDWQPGRHLAWRFLFDDLRGWQFTDRHLMPDSPYFRVTAGGYRLRPLGQRRTQVTLYTRYRITTPVNAYSEAWGQLFLGDLENNLLSIVKGRAERQTPGYLPRA